MINIDYEMEETVKPPPSTMQNYHFFCNLQIFSLIYYVNSYVILIYGGDLC